jgi:hypothetical protein
VGFQIFGDVVPRSFPTRQGGIPEVCRLARGVAGKRVANVKLIEETSAMSTQTESGKITGTKDKNYNIIWFTEACLDNALRLETYIADAERDGDDELAEFFRKAQADSRKGAEKGKALLKSRL